MVGAFLTTVICIFPLRRFGVPLPCSTLSATSTRETAHGLPNLGDRAAFERKRVHRVRKCTRTKLRVLERRFLLSGVIPVVQKRTSGLSLVS